MEKDLLLEMGIAGEDEEDSEEETYEDCNEENIDNLESTINDLQLQVENIMREEFNVPGREKSLSNNEHSEHIPTIPCSEQQNYMENDQNTEAAAMVEKIASDEDHNDILCDTFETPPNVYNVGEGFISNVKDEATCNNDCFDTQSMWSVSTTSTIAPDLIKKRTKQALDKRDRKSKSKKIIAKGEASAATRMRRDNTATVKESTGIWGWE